MLRTTWLTSFLPFCQTMAQSLEKSLAKYEKSPKFFANERIQYARLSIPRCEFLSQRYP